MDISMPSDFPMADFRPFGLATQKFFPKLLSDEDLNDPQERLRHFQWAWHAGRFRYRRCFDSSEEFSVLLDNAGESWRKGGADEELSYKLERSIYVFFVSGVSIFDSLGFCLYFFGNTLRSINFPYVVDPKKITLNATIKGFAASFPNANITQRLTKFSKESEFVALEDRIPASLNIDCRVRCHIPFTVWIVEFPVQKKLIDDSDLNGWVEPRSIKYSLKPIPQTFTC
jgi:hypothetical protein